MVITELNMGVSIVVASALIGVRLPMTKLNPCPEERLKEMMGLGTYNLDILSINILSQFYF